MRRFFEPASVAAVQHGVFHVTQVALSPRAVQQRAIAGHLCRQHAGVYSVVPRHLLKREGLWMAAVLACGAGAVLSHRSAAALLALRDWGGTKIDVTVPRRSRREHEGVKVRCSTTLTDGDVTVVNNIPCTTVARTLLDLAEVVTPRQLEHAFDQAEIIDGLDLRATQDQLARNPTRPGAKAVRNVLETHYIGRTPTWSENEEAVPRSARTSCGATSAS
jgi:predicted transcriptional regulator of viral defense system